MNLSCGKDNREWCHGTRFDDDFGTCHGKAKQSKSSDDTQVDSIPVSPNSSSISPLDKQSSHIKPEHFIDFVPLEMPLGETVQSTLENMVNEPASASPISTSFSPHEHWALPKPVKNNSRTNTSCSGTARIVKEEPTFSIEALVASGPMASGPIYDSLFESLVHDDGWLQDLTHEKLKGVPEQSSPVAQIDAFRCCNPLHDLVGKAWPLFSDETQEAVHNFMANMSSCFPTNSCHRCLQSCV